MSQQTGQQLGPRPLDGDPLYGLVVLVDDRPRVVPADGPAVAYERAARVWVRAVAAAAGIVALCCGLGLVTCGLTRDPVSEVAVWRCNGTDCVTGVVYRANDTGAWVAPGDVASSVWSARAPWIAAGLVLIAAAVVALIAWARARRAAATLLSQTRPLPRRVPSCLWPVRPLLALESDDWSLVAQADAIVAGRTDLAGTVRDVLWRIAAPAPVDAPTAAPSATRAAVEGWQREIESGYRAWIDLREQHAPTRA